jgi:hypothetical protein
LPGNAINNAHALKYASPIALAQSMRVRARAFYGQWSAVHEATFAVGPVAESLRISEIMYHPANTGNPDDPNTEYIELTNIGTEPINLNLVRFTNGIDFTFPSTELSPGAYCLVVRDIAAFQAKYGWVSNPPVQIAGQYSGSLANDGERIELVDAIGTTIQDFRYEDDWYDNTDGGGYSLVIVDPASADLGQWSQQTGWRASTKKDGSPGAADTNP